MKVKAHNGKEYYLVEVIAHILKYLKDQFIQMLNESGLKMKATDFNWVVTVPAIWRARGKQMMREAGYKVVFFLCVYCLLCSHVAFITLYCRLVCALKIPALIYNQLPICLHLLWNSILRNSL